MTLPSHQTSHEPRSSIRFNARFDTATRQKVDDLAKRFHQPRAAVLCHIMQWGLDRGPTEKIDQGNTQGPVRHLYLYVASDLYEHVQRAATTAVVKVAPWLRHMVRQVTITDFPASWQEERLEGRSHDSHVYDKRYMIRLDDMTWEKLEDFSRHFDTSAAAIIRQLVAQATIEDFPQAWQMADDPRRAHPRREASTRRRPS